MEHAVTNIKLLLRKYPENGVFRNVSLADTPFIYLTLSQILLL